MAEKRWRNRYRIHKLPPPEPNPTTGETRFPEPLTLACTICGAHKDWAWDESGMITDHCVSYGTREEALVYTKAKYQLARVETLGPFSGDYSEKTPERGREGWS